MSTLEVTIEEKTLGIKQNREKSPPSDAKRPYESELADCLPSIFCAQRIGLLGPFALTHTPYFGFNIIYGIRSSFCVSP